MATSFEAASGTTLPNPFAPRVFTTTGDVAYVSARLFDKNEPGRIVDEFVIYARGEFQGKYKRGSTRVSNVFTVVRDGGWSSDLALYVEPKGAAAIRQLQPLTDSPYGAWSLEQGNGSQKSDRSGNNRHADSAFIAEPLRVASPVPGKSAWANGGRVAQNYVAINGAGGLGHLLASHFVTTGFAFSFWACWNGFAQNSYSDQWWLAWASNSTCLLPWYISQGVAATPDGTVKYHDASGFDRATDLKVTLGKWSHCCTSLDTAGNLLMGLDGVYRSYTGVPLTAPAAEYPFTIGGVAYPTNFNRSACASFFDVMSWDKPRTQAQFEAQRLSAEGLAA